MREIDKKRKRTPEEVEDCGSDAEFPTLADEEDNDGATSMEDNSRDRR